MLSQQSDISKLYRELADWYPLVTPVGDYAEETGFYEKLFVAHCAHPARTLLDLGCGGGHNAAYLKQSFACTLTDCEPAMLDLSRRLNPECEHLQGDMRSVRLGRVFDCVLVHDAVSYMKTPEDLRLAVETAFVHTAPGGVALFMPDFVSENFQSGTDTGGSDCEGRGLRYLEWRWQTKPNDNTFVNDMAFLLRERDGSVRVVQDRHVMGLFPRAFWLQVIAEVGFRPLELPFEHSDFRDEDHPIFLGLKSEHQ